MIEAEIQQAYDQLLQRRANERNAPLISLDMVRELAELRTIGQEQVPLLDEVLSHPVTRNEFYFLREVARARNRKRWNGVPIWAAAAAVLVLALGASVFVRSALQQEPEAMRGRAAEIALLTPDDSATLGAQTRFIWRSAEGAVNYKLELLDAEGTVVWSTMGMDTVAVLPDDVERKIGARYTWLVRATLNDGTTSISRGRSVIAR